MRSISCFLALLLVITVVPATADFASGLTAYQKGDFASALKEWRPLAEKGDSRAQYNLGLMYYDGQGVPQDYAQAANWFERSAQQDYVKAQHNLGAMYGAGKGVKRDHVVAYKWLNVCAAKGDAGCVSQRDLIAKKLNASKLATAQRMASDFTPKKESGK